jgi:hypothetical protein
MVNEHVFDVTGNALVLERFSTASQSLRLSTSGAA